MLLLCHALQTTVVRMPVRNAFENSLLCSKPLTSRGSVSVPAAPVAPRIELQTNTSLEISWSNVTGATSYYVEYSVVASSLSERISSATRTFGAQTTNTSALITGLQPATSYHTFVVASNRAGNSSESNATFVTSESPSGACERIC